MKCLICETIFNSNRSLCKHIRSEHTQTIQEYYDNYIKSEPDGKCIICGNNTTFVDITKGYHKYCSKACVNKSSTHVKSVMRTKEKRYGFAGYNNPDKHNETWYNRPEEERKEIYEKRDQTTISRYGDKNNYTKYKQTMKENYGVESAWCLPKVQSAEAWSRRHDTLKVNGNQSKLEVYLEQRLDDLNIEYIPQYGDERYPYHCDIYIPKTDTFIEINGYWTHNTYFFDPNSEADINQLEVWKERAKTSKHFATAIHVWTELDIQKRNCAIKNNLNYIVLRNIKDIDKYVDCLGIQ